MRNGIMILVVQRMRKNEAVLTYFKSQNLRREIDENQEKLWLA
jgi:hypothetical protein